MNWQNFFSGDNSKINWFYLVGFALAMPFAFLAFAIIVWHVWIAKKPMDGEMVRLLLGVLGIASGGAGLSAFSRHLEPDLDRGGGTDLQERPTSKRVRVCLH